MAFTGHGHVIPGTYSHKDIPPTRTLPCGGPGTCPVCTDEAVQMTGVPTGPDENAIPAIVYVDGERRLAGTVHITEKNEGIVYITSHFMTEALFGYRLRD